jgi:hypothetical protein
MATGRIGTTPVLTTRWSKQPAAGTTSLSGLDDNSVSLVYSVGYEAVYQNGVLLSRGNDYTATNGTTITLTTATVAGDIIEVFANQTIPLTDTYSQTVSDGRFIKNTLTTTTGDIIYASAANTPARLAIGSTDQVLKVSGGIPAWGAAPSPSYVGCMLYNSADFTNVANATDYTLTFNSEKWDTDAFHSTSSNTSRITIPSGKAGKYLVQGLVHVENQNQNTVICRLKKNGNNFQVFQTVKISSNYVDAGFNTIADLVAGDYLEFIVWTDSGISTLRVDYYTGWFAATYLGA